uniref:Protein tyrosine kinase n=1 Tax=Tetraselmis sp. GSL018 TaxID=582737 RepID=A0A061RYZ2_9CHLO
MRLWLREAVERLRQNDPSLTQLDFYRCVIRSESAEALAEALWHNGTLTKLELDRNLIGDRGAKELAKALGHNIALTELSLEWNGIGDNGAEALAWALRHNGALKKLNLSGNKIGDRGAKVLARALLHNSALTTLNFWRNSICNEGAEALAAALRDNCTLIGLNLKWNGIRDEGAEALAQALRCNGALKELDLSGNKICNTGAEALAESLLHNVTLVELNLSRNTISANVLQEVQAALLVEGRGQRETEPASDPPASPSQAQNAPPPSSQHKPPLQTAGTASADTVLQEPPLEAAPPKPRVQMPRVAAPAQPVAPPSPPPQAAAASEPTEPTGLSAPRRDGDTPQSGTSRDTLQPPSFQAVPSRVEEIPFCKLQLHAAIGAGSSKSVYRARWCGQDVAALILRNGNATAELAVFERLTRRPGLTPLLGVSRDPKGRQVIVTKYAPLGSLNNVLADLENSGRSASDLVLMKCAMQVCDGMLQLAEEGLIHRDLALRNVLVFSFDPENHRAVEVTISDYGLTRQGSCYYGGSEAVPVRWMPPEALKKRRWSEKSDIWAFGVLMWELWSAADLPYAFIGSDEEVARRVCTCGDRLKKPEGCPDGVFALMERCWIEQASQRPSFRELKDELLDIYAGIQNLYNLADHSTPSRPHQGEHQDPECVVCYDTAACVALLPCGHVFCEECARRVQQCPICRKEVTGTLRIHQP